MDLKELLLKDLGARVCYGVKCRSQCFKSRSLLWINDSRCVFKFRGENGEDEYRELNIDEWNVRPYLRSLSKMTEEERKEYKHLVAFSGSPDGAANFIDWLNKKMFAYRTIDGKDMFELGLALEAPKGMYE